MCSVRVFWDKKLGALTFDGEVDEKKANVLIDKAIELAKHGKKDKEFKNLPKSKGIRQIEEIKSFSPDEMAESVSKIVKIAQNYNLLTAGYVSLSTFNLGVFNSHNLTSLGRTQVAEIAITMSKEESSGYSEGMGKQFSYIDYEKLAQIAAEKAIKSSKPKELPPGKYTVLLEPNAVAEMILYLAYMGLDGKKFIEGRSFMSGKIGEKITGENITLVDDAYHSENLFFKFDLEGVPKEKVVLIENGIAKNVVYDSYYAHKIGKTSTGHSEGQVGGQRIFPTHMVLKKGKDKVEELIKKIDKGLLITRFWYSRIIDPDKTLITGMTRDGTFWIENGEIKYGVKNLRYTINILETFKNVIGISQEWKLVNNILVPTLLIKDFNFSDKTEY
jgi:predicted Zn-dependent protease